MQRKQQQLQRECPSSTGTLMRACHSWIYNSKETFFRSFPKFHTISQWFDLFCSCYLTMAMKLQVKKSRSAKPTTERPVTEKWPWKWYQSSTNLCLMGGFICHIRSQVNKDVTVYVCKLTNRFPSKMAWAKLTLCSWHIILFLFYSPPRRVYERCWSSVRLWQRIPDYTFCMGKPYLCFWAIYFCCQRLSVRFFQT